MSNQDFGKLGLLLRLMGIGIRLSMVPAYAHALSTSSAESSRFDGCAKHHEVVLIVEIGNRDVDLEDFTEFQFCVEHLPQDDPSCVAHFDFGPGGVSDGLVIGLVDFSRFAECLAESAEAGITGAPLTPDTCLRSSGPVGAAPQTGSFSLHGRPVDVLPDGKILTYVRARYYDAQNGRWLQRDPVGFADGGNLYESFGSNPARFVDPQGELIDELVNLIVNRRFLSNEEIDRATTAGGVGLAQARSRLLSDIGNATTALGDIDALLLVPQGFEQGFRQPAIEATTGRFESLIAGQVAAGADLESASSNLTLTVFFIGDLTGATQLGEGLAGVDLASNQMLTTGESFRRGVQGGSTFVIIAAGPKALRNARARSAALSLQRAEAAVAAESTATSAVRARVLANIAESQAAPAASNFEVFAAREALARGVVNPRLVRFTQPTASPFFSTGQTLDETIAALRGGQLTASDLPAIRVFESQGRLFSLDNRRLVAFKNAGLQEIPIQPVSLSDPAITPLLDRFNPIRGRGEIIVIVPRAGRVGAQVLLREHGLIR